MEHLEGYLKSSTSKEAAATLCPNQTMLVAAVSLGISDARGLYFSAFAQPPSRPHFIRVVDIVFSTRGRLLLGRHLHLTWGAWQI